MKNNKATLVQYHARGEWHIRARRTIAQVIHNESPALCGRKETSAHQIATGLQSAATCKRCLKRAGIIPRGRAVAPSTSVETYYPNQDKD